MTDLLPGAEPFSASGGPLGVLVLHGFSGSPHAVRPLATAFAAAGHTVEAPLLPGHGTSVEDMVGTGFDDWSAAVAAAHRELAQRCRQVFVVGLSMGGTLALWLAAREPSVAGVVTINAPALVDPDAMDGIRSFVEAGAELMDTVVGDIADPEAQDLGYELAPLVPLLSLWEAIEQLDLAAVAVPALVISSAQDHTIDPASSRHIASSVTGPVETLVLPRSYHVAPLDLDRDLLIERSLAFVHRLAAGA
jgi:carboxylesterase